MKPSIRSAVSWLVLATFVSLAATPALLAVEPGGPPFYLDKMQLLNWIDAAGQTHPIHTADAWQLRRAHILAGMQQVMGPLPNVDSKSALEVKELESEELPTVIRKKISFQASPGDTIPAYLLIPKNLTSPAPAMLCLHGTSGSRGRTAGLGADYPRYTLELAERGYVTIAPDYTLLGENQTDPQSLGYASGTMKGIWSHIRALDLLESLPEVDPQRMGCIGLSLGGHNSLFVAAFDPRLKVVVTSSGFDSFVDYMDGDPSGWCQQRYMPRIETEFDKDPRKLPFDFPEVLAAIAPRALYIHAPQGDDNFKVESVKRCVAAAQSVYHLLDADNKIVAAYPPGEHGFPVDERIAAYDFVDRILRAEPRAATGGTE